MFFRVLDGISSVFIRLILIQLGVPGSSKYSWRGGQSFPTLPWRLWCFVWFNEKRHSSKFNEIVENARRMVWTTVWPEVCQVWPMVWTRVWPTVWTTVWPWFCSVWPMVWRKSVQSGQWWSKSVGLANTYQCLFWVADFILGILPVKVHSHCLVFLNSILITCRPIRRPTCDIYLKIV